MIDLLPKKRIKHLVFLVILIMLLSVGASFFISPLILLLLLVGFFAVLFFAFYPEIGLYGMVLLYPFIYWQFYFKIPPTFLADLLQDINIPYIDLLAMAVFAGWFLRIIYLRITENQKISWNMFPGIILFILFIVASSLSLINVENIFSGVKFILRPLAFFYLMFVILPFNIIKNKKTLLNVFRMFYIVGMFVAAMGLWSLIFTDRPGWLNPAIPVAVFGVHILGTNHNLIGEILISVIPLVFVLLQNETKELWRRIYFLSLGFLIAITLLTLSRTAWVALFIEFLILVIINYRHRAKKLAFYGLIIMIILLPIFTYMYMYILSYDVHLSNYNRMLMTDIAFDVFSEHPWIGSGAGTFREQLSNYYIYLIEFGEPSEAHGVVQKLLPEVGILGLTAFFALWGYILYKLIWVFRKIKSSPAWRFVVLNCIMAVAGSMVFQLFNTSYFVSKLWLPMGVALAAANLALKYTKKKEIGN